MSVWRLSTPVIQQYQDKEAEAWYRQALSLSPFEERDTYLCNLGLLLRANGSRHEEAVSLIIR